jgi:hypothetical protein
MTLDEKARKIAHTGSVESCEFIRADDDDERDPGTYLTIKLDDEHAGITGGRVTVSWITETP